MGLGENWKWIWSCMSSVCIVVFFFFFENSMSSHLMHFPIVDFTALKY